MHANCIEYGAIQISNTNLSIVYSRSRLLDPKSAWSIRIPFHQLFIYHTPHTFEDNNSKVAEITLVHDCTQTFYVVYAIHHKIHHEVSHKMTVYVRLYDKLVICLKIL